MKKDSKNSIKTGEATPAGETKYFTLRKKRNIVTEGAKLGRPKGTTGGRPIGTTGLRKLTVGQKAEIAALYSSGTASLVDLAKKYDKDVGTISRVIKAMGVVRGSSVKETTKKIAEQIEQRALTDLEVIMQKIVKAKEEYYLMNNALAKMVWNEIKAEKGKENADLGRLKDAMSTLKIASDLIGNSRKEIFSILNVERFDEDRSHDELPELTVRELTGNEIKLLQNQSEEDELGGSMMAEDGSGEGI